MAAGGRPTQAIRPELGERIANARERAGLSQPEVAKLMGVSQPTVVAWERRASNIRSDNLIKLAKIFHVSADELLGLAAPKPEKPRSRCSDLFQSVSTLPRRQQNRILDQVEDALMGLKRRQNQSS